MAAKFPPYLRDVTLTAEDIDVEPMADETQGGGDGGGGPGALNERVVRLETHFEYIRKDLDEIKVGQKETLGKLSDLSANIKVEFAKRPTTTGLWGMLATLLALALAIAGLVFVVADYAAKVAPGASTTGGG